MSDTGFQDFGSSRFVRRLGRIDEVKFGFEDHNLPGFHIGVDFGGMHGGTGWHTTTMRDVPIDGGVLFVQIALMEALGVREWSDLQGKVVWALFDKADPFHSSVKGFIRLEFDGDGSIVFEDTYEAARLRRVERDGNIATNARKADRERRGKFVKKSNLEKVISGDEAMLLQGADKKVSREWAEEIVADVMGLAGATVMGE